MYDKWFIEGQISLEASLTSPWSAPGTAPTFGEGCGANGGNPYGCGFGEPRTISNLDFQSYNFIKEKTVNHWCSVKVLVYQLQLAKNKSRLNSTQNRSKFSVYGLKMTLNCL